MKKLLSVLLALLIAFSLVGCEEAIEVLQDVADIASEWNETSAAPTTQDTASATEGVSSSSEEAASASEDPAPALDEYGVYTTKEDVALYLHIYGHLPENFITKSEARDLGWEGGSLEPYAPGMCIGGDRFGNYEELLPTGHNYYECDIDTLGASSRGAKRIVFSDDGLIYYTEDHYESFTLLYGEE